ncbi:hypothetical protein BDK51DRAFT_26350 [Blyttiomyces helicus]|uniref:Uncharacterized protein n=1 Tax=Blyttiomyces helicus TaxID=388810 RepID=A0A4V1IR32_9FUNG|nr:hypothetical protein BDK51DRAFT_26350 [Blyttiomyces helicus]|eukprot:RKO88647.1 hypothetical protein BDK51DRAFT_26350 [Blyttiomyces helicus]
MRVKRCGLPSTISDGAAKENSRPETPPIQPAGKLSPLSSRNQSHTLTSILPQPPQKLQRLIPQRLPFRTLAPIRSSDLLNKAAGALPEPVLGFGKERDDAKEDDARLFGIFCVDQFVEGAQRGTGAENFGNVFAGRHKEKSVADAANDNHPSFLQGMKYTMIAGLRDVLTVTDFFFIALGDAVAFSGPGVFEVGIIVKLSVAGGLERLDDSAIATFEKRGSRVQVRSFLSAHVFEPVVEFEREPARKALRRPCRDPASDGGHNSSVERLVRQLLVLLRVLILVVLVVLVLLLHDVGANRAEIADYRLITSVFRFPTHPSSKVYSGFVTARVILRSGTDFCWKREGQAACTQQQRM